MQQRTETTYRKYKIFFMGDIYKSPWKNSAWARELYGSEIVTINHDDETVKLELCGGDSELSRLEKFKRGSTPFDNGPHVCLIIFDITNPNPDYIAQYKKHVPLIVSDGFEDKPRIIVVGYNPNNGKEICSEDVKKIKKYCESKKLPYVEINQHSDINSLYRDAINLIKGIDDSPSLNRQITTANSKLMLMLLARKDNKCSFNNPYVPNEIIQVIANKYIECEFTSPISFSFFKSQDNAQYPNYKLSEKENNNNLVKELPDKKEDCTCLIM